MTEDETAATPGTPWHLWVIGGVSTLWNAFGGYDYYMTKTRNADYLAGYSPEQLEHWENMPLIANIGWGLGVWCALLGSILLLMRSKWSLQAFRLSIFGVIISTIYTYFMSNGLEMGGVAGAIIWGVICLIALGLMVYAQAMTTKGVLR